MFDRGEYSISNQISMGFNVSTVRTIHCSADTICKSTKSTTNHSANKNYKICTYFDLHTKIKNETKMNIFLM